MDKLKNWTIVGLFIAIVILLLFRGCHTPPKDYNVLQVKYDTIQTTKIDTVYYPKEKLIYINSFKPSKEVKSLDTNGLYLCNTLNTYQDSLIDTNIIIRNKMIIRGEPKEMWLSYKLLKPIITKEITKTITKTNTEIKYRPYCYSVFGGISIGGNQNSLASITPFLAIRSQKTYVLAGCNLVDKTYNVGVGYNIFNIK